MTANPHGQRFGESPEHKLPAGRTGEVSAVYGLWTNQVTLSLL